MRSHSVTGFRELVTALLDSCLKHTDMLAVVPSWTPISFRYNLLTTGFALRMAAAGFVILLDLHLSQRHGSVYPDDFFA